jgi:hypothetical protein
MQVLLILLFLLNQSFAKTTVIPGCVEPSNYSMEGKKVTLCWVEKIEGWVSSDCIVNKTPRCGSLVIREQASQKSIELDESDTRGGKNPGCAICLKLGGKVKYGVEEGESQQTFCEAKDGSYIDSNTLTNTFFSNPKEKGGM